MADDHFDHAVLVLSAVLLWLIVLVQVVSPKAKCAGGAGGVAVFGVLDLHQKEKEVPGMKGERDLSKIENLSVHTTPSGI